MTCPALYGISILIGKTNNKLSSPNISKSFQVGAIKRDAFQRDLNRTTEGRDITQEWMGKEVLPALRLEAGRRQPLMIGTRVPGCENSKCKGPEAAMSLPHFRGRRVTDEDGAG